ncbi:hypothetical protein H257_02099 [Aphanomyces astaci]|uniref:Uncharacterized protein n=1 Tax=Aphanomyces astaci TaxID=112090 RepID=W4H6B0_APHAT|nr:hypothetical protein H257_02099 [Aphanomyces astaci]ETV87101.1 hypothetical protein H257_02099 [Aphanomyces astaci]|eukprot:XP_009823900.1 hypothetical protein H257_02099 [Aphanomyces astaci]
MAYARPGIARRFSEFRRFLVRPRSGFLPRGWRFAYEISLTSKEMKWILNDVPHEGPA